MSISDGVDADAANFNAAFMSRTANTNSTGSITAGTNFKRAVQDALTAFATGGQSSATAITKDIAVFSTVATAADSGKLPTSSAGLHIIVYNRGSNAMALFPATGDAIDGLSANSSISIASGDSIAASCRAAGQWVTESFQFNLLTVPNGGTGAATLAQYGVLLGNGTGAVAVLATDASTTKVLTSGGTGDNPTWTEPATASAAPVPSVQKFTATGSTTGYKFTVTSANATVGATYTNNGNTYTVVATITASTTLWATQASVPQASGTLTKASGTGDATITFSVAVAQGTYTTPASTRWIVITLVGGGGGGVGGGSAAGTAATAGGTTTFGTPLLTGSGGAEGIFQAAGGSGGSATISTGTGLAVAGGDGGGAHLSQGTTGGNAGGQGGSSALGGAGYGGPYNGVGRAAAANSGSGGGGGGSATPATNIAGSGGGSGGYIKVIITGPSATYLYAIGASGSAGGAGTSGHAGGAGAAGQIFIEEYY